MKEERAIANQRVDQSVVAFLGHVLDEYKAGVITRPQAVGILSKCMAATEQDDSPLSMGLVILAVITAISSFIGIVWCIWLLGWMLNILPPASEAYMFEWIGPSGFSVLLVLLCLKRYPHWSGSFAKNK